MSLDGLGQEHFRKARVKNDDGMRNIELLRSEQQAFIALRDPKILQPKVSEPLLSQYQRNGLKDCDGIQRVVRVVSIPKGTRIYKLTGGFPEDDLIGPIEDRDQAANRMKNEVLFRFPLMSPWWAPVAPFQEDSDGIKGHFEDMVFNSVALPGPGSLTLREYARFMSAVVLEWNTLTYYVEMTLSKDVKAYWGQYEEQIGANFMKQLEVPGSASPEKWNEALHGWIEKTDGSYFIRYKGEPQKRYYLPDWLGGLDAWQFYIPKFEKIDIDSGTVTVIPARNTEALAKYFGCSDVFGEAEIQSQSIRQKIQNKRAGLPFERK